MKVTIHVDEGELELDGCHGPIPTGDEHAKPATRGDVRRLLTAFEAAEVRRAQDALHVLQRLELLQRQGELHDARLVALTRRLFPPRPATFRTTVGTPVDE